MILLAFTLETQENIAAILSERLGGNLEIIKGSRGDRLRWISMAMESAKLALRGRLKPKKDLSQHFQALQENLAWDESPDSIACFDVSHSLGEATVVSCVVFGPLGPIKALYRRFNIRAKTNGDDMMAMREGLTRYFTRLKRENKCLPRILLVDGGKGQLGMAKAVLEELQVEGVFLLAVAKGEGRKVGLETLYQYAEGKKEPIQFAPLALQLLLQLRDEAHRFAITAHRKQREAKRRTSSLEGIEGIGGKRSQTLLQYFGGRQEVLQASIEELAKVPGISQALANRIYQSLHGS